ncbi:multidrug effflux MFS transporter [Oceaniglobus indicus]|uniref:multidrug effflux MFS transporter n=1 Tax=Oceaniglobus indicus TaxID=2047749 RepID=UPI000C1A4CA0|nr:multidrug effflux MFS transporter [Oceaniglobus indicus]
MTAPTKTLSRPEFVALMAVMMAMVAFSIDAMLPVLPRIADELSPGNPNAAQLILTSFLFGMGIGTLFAGPVSDAMGRKPAIYLGFALYLGGAALATIAPSLETMLLARILQGLGAAGPRIVSTAIIRDRFEGREMARVLSFVMMIFIMIPAIAPFVGSLVIAAFGWRSIFGAFMIFALIGLTWLAVRQPETLAPEARRPLRPASLKAALIEVLKHPMVRIYIAVLTLGQGQMFAFLSSVQQVFGTVFGVRETFPLWFMGIALVSGSSTVLNATLVMRLGMRRMAMGAYAMQMALSAVLLAAGLLDAIPAALTFPAFLLWAVSIFAMAGLTFGNINALALQPMGHIAGMAASVVGAVGTTLGVCIAIPIGLAFNGTIYPLMIGTLICSSLAWWLMRLSREADPTPKKVIPAP